MEKTNLSEAREKIDLLTIEIEVHEKYLDETLAKLTVLEAKIEVLKERKKSLINYLNTENN